VAIDLDGRTGRIDRLVAFERAAGRREWWVLDYKLATTPDAAPAHRSQVLVYAAALARLQPGDRIRAALIGGDGSLHPVGET
jgi:ATP-dependent helicase/nuclease subunit A